MVRTDEAVEHSGDFEHARRFTLIPNGMQKSPGRCRSFRCLISRRDQYFATNGPRPRALATSDGSALARPIRIDGMRQENADAKKEARSHKLCHRFTP